MPDATRQTRILTQKLQSLQAAGVQFLPRPHMMPATHAAPSAAAARVPPTQANTPTADREPPKQPTLSLSDPLPATSRMSPSEQREALHVLQQEVAGCTRCHELATTRTQTVFGVGNPSARLVFLGEAPGADEDRQGEPFVGRAGQLLTKIIEACTLRRQDVYILNILKCRPPGNRNPASEEAANCSGFLQQQLQIIQPEFICCLGAVAAQNLLQTTTPIGKLRGSFHQHGTARVMVTYHPAYLLRNPDAKRLVWDDMQQLMREMGIAVKSRNVIDGK